MKKSLIAIVIIIALLTAGGVYESFFITKQFKEMNNTFTALYDKIDKEDAVEDDVIAAQNKWLEKKKYLHAFIPHGEIKEFDLWIAESVILVRDGKWTEALSKVEVIIELTEQIPKTFAISLENIL